MRQLAIVGARIWGADRPEPTSLLVRDGRITAIGPDVHTKAADVIDLGGGWLLPGFTESHTHFHRTAILREHYLDFDRPDVHTIDAVLALVRERAASLPAGEWLQGDNLVGGRLAEARLPDRYELDAITTAHPVLLRGMGKHVVVANSLALRLAGIDATTPDPPGGRIERDASGEPTGVLHERGKLRLDTTRVDTVVPPMSAADRLRALRNGIASLHRDGVTSIHEMTRASDEFADYLRLREDGRLGIRVVSYVRVVEAQARLDDLLAIGLRSGYGDPWLRLGGVKISIDGACTFRNAAVYDPYPGEPENLGIIRVEQPELDDLVRRADSAGLQVAVHAIGPRAVDMALASFQALETTGNPLRHRIEHAYLPPCDGQLSRLSGLGLLLSTQPAFIESLGDAWFDIFPEESVARMMPLRSALDAGLTVLANSDCPSAQPRPLLGVQAAITRRTAAGRSLGTREAVTVEEAVDMYTTAPALAAREEQSRGRITVGMRADLVGLAEDLRTTPSEKIANIPVVLTVVGGEPVYEGG